MTYQRKNQRKSRAPQRRKPARRAEDLALAGLVAGERTESLDALAGRFAMTIPGAMIERMTADQNDPLARQFVPSERECIVLPEERSDPTGDKDFTPVKGIVHRYPDRVLLKPVHLCPVYCRFCFRRDSIGRGGEILSREELDAALSYVRGHQAIWEVILSGGDPLMLTDDKLRRITRQLDAIDHVGILRLHTRMPVAEPARITKDLIRIFTGAKNLAVYVVLHCNHISELGEEARAACRAFVDSGIPMLGQTVLLKGVNDDPEVLAELMRGMVRNRIKPYYLHHCDLAQGIGHFRTTIAEGQALMRALRGTISGLCQPTYVLDIPGGHGKVPIGPVYLRETCAGEEGRCRIEDYLGETHVYPPR